jgi:hypothetical protein
MEIGGFGGHQLRLSHRRAVRRAARQVGKEDGPAAVSSDTRIVR